MGANGSHASGVLNTESGRQYRTIFTIGDNIKVLEQKASNKGGKLPEESHTPNRIYVSLMANGKDVKAIAKYGNDGKKIYEIHTVDHKGLSPHYHFWENGKPKEAMYPLTSEMNNLLKKVRNYEDNK